MSESGLDSDAQAPESETSGAGKTADTYGIPSASGHPSPPLAPGRPPEDGSVDLERFPDTTVGPGYALGSFEDIGEGEGFRKVRSALGVTAFGVNVLVRQPGYQTKWHYHALQEELYFVHKGAIEMEFGDGTTHSLQAGSFARVDASTTRRIKILGPGETVYLCMGGKDGYVGHDGRSP